MLIYHLENISQKRFTKPTPLLGLFIKASIVTFVSPILEYAPVVWFPVLRKHLNNIESVQRRATRMVDGYKNLTYSERLVCLNLPSLKYQRIVNGMVEIYKHLYTPHLRPGKNSKRAGYENKTK